MAYVTNDFFADVSLSRAPRHAKPFSGFGETAISAAGNNYDVWLGPTKEQPGPVTAGFQPDVVSSSANDTAAGTGVQSVSVHYVDTSYVSQNEEVELDGTTAVTMTATDVLFVQCMHATSVGSGGVAAGNIDLLNGVTVMKRIATDKNRCLSAMRIVPAGFNFLLYTYIVGGDSKNGRATLRLTATALDGELLDGVYVEQATATVNDTTTTGQLRPPAVFPEKTIIKVKADTTVNDAYLGAVYVGWLEDN